MLCLFICYLNYYDVFVPIMMDQPGFFSWSRSEVGKKTDIF